MLTASKMSQKLQENENRRIVDVNDYDVFRILASVEAADIMYRNSRHNISNRHLYAFRGVMPLSERGVVATIAFISKSFGCRMVKTRIIISHCSYCGLLDVETHKENSDWFTVLNITEKGYSYLERYNKLLDMVGGFEKIVTRYSVVKNKKKALTA